MTSPLQPLRGSLHHVELRVGALADSIPSWGWLLEALGYEQFRRWADGISWRFGSIYLVLESSPVNGLHDRRMPGLSHLAFHAGSRAQVDALWTAAPGHGWARLYEDRYPWAGGAPAPDSPGHYAAFIENGEHFKIELVASPETT